MREWFLLSGLLMATLVTGMSPVFAAYQEGSGTRDDDAMLQATDEVLRHFARAYLAAEELVTSGKRSAVQSSDSVAGMADKLAAALAEQGLTIDTYNRIAASLNRDDETRERVFEIIEQERLS